MQPDYTVSEVVEIGKAEEVILGGKEIFATDDGTEGLPASDFDE